LRSRLKANLLLGFCAVAFVLLDRVPHLTLNPLLVGTEVYILFIPVLALTLVALMSGLTVLTPLLENRLAILLGEASYSLYLVHGYFVPGQPSTRFAYTLSLAGSIASSIVLYWFLERPARRIWRKVLGSGRAWRVRPVPYSGAVG
jgi:peptidoglycan/LPS O-acetylase OafA/YrhL